MRVEVTLPAGVSARLDTIPLEVERLAFVCAFLSDTEMRRLLTGAQSRAICDHLGLPVNRVEAVNCRTIAAHYRGEK